MEKDDCVKKDVNEEAMPTKSYCISALVGIINRNDDAFAYKVLVRTISLEKVLHK